MAVEINLYKVINASFDTEKGMFSDGVKFDEKRFDGIYKRREVLHCLKCNWHGSYEFRKLYKLIKKNNYPTTYIKNYTHTVDEFDFHYPYDGKYLVVDKVFGHYDSTKYFSKFFFRGNNTIKYAVGRDNIINSLRKFISYKAFEDKAEREELIKNIMDIYDKVSKVTDDQLFLEIAW